MSGQINKTVLRILMLATTYYDEVFVRGCFRISLLTYLMHVFFYKKPVKGRSFVLLLL